MAKGKPTILAGSRSGENVTDRDLHSKYGLSMWARLRETGRPFTPNRGRTSDCFPRRQASNRNSADTGPFNVFAGSRSVRRLTRSSYPPPAQISVGGPPQTYGLLRPAMSRSSSTRQAIRDAVSRHGSTQPRRSRFRRILASLSLVGLSVWLLFWAAGAFSPPAAVAELRTLVDQEVSRLNRVARNELPYSDQGLDMRKLFENMRDLPDSQRQQVRQEIGRLFSARERAEVGSFFALPPDRRLAELDRRIKADEARRQQWAAERAARNTSTQNQPGQTAATRDSNGPSNSRGPRPATGQPGQGDSGRQWGQGRGRTEEARNERMKNRLDATSPDDRAKRTEYRRALAERREKLGIAPGRGGSGRRPG